MNNKAIEYFENRLCELNGMAQFEDDADIASNIECEICFIESAISAIEKQIPKKWIDTKSYLTCPVCESFYDMPVAEKYCPNCGQRLKED